MNDSIKKGTICVVGAGLMGHGIAQIFAVKGYNVWISDIDEKVLNQALVNIRKNLALFAENDLVSQDEIEPALSRIRISISLEEAASTAEVVIEAVSENLELKQTIFKQLDEICSPGTILCTNTSVISITQIAEKAINKSRIVGTHFWNPSHLIPLVEVVPGDQTNPETVDRTYDFLSSVGKHPVKVKKDVPGFVGNRLQHALWREAISIVDQGIAEPAVVDEVIKMGFGIRLPVLGPLENADLVGLDLTHAIHDYILEHINASPEPAPILKTKIDQGCLGFKTGEGLQKWTDDEKAGVRSRLFDHLVAWNKLNDS
ncbi:MAG: 3-hydroxyacyl-CoA dehydrogenase family protein [Desulfobacterales bacterium]|nr:3-hydroxyacyl-CoA dehydrogenase family protein [Desulfobacterales bacterium]